MYGPTFVLFLLSVIHCYGAQQIQMPEASAFTSPEDDLQAQIKELQKNVTDIWNYIYQLRTAVSQHLTHLRAHQSELESFRHSMEHLHESELHSTGHQHSGEQHSHSGEQHSHSGEHSHGSGHSHSGEHSHGSDHSHSGEHSHGSDHSHSGEHSHGSDHSHSGEQHAHSDEHGHYSHSYSHSHTSHDHSKEDSHSHGDDHHHGHDHKDSHESEDLQQQTQVAEPVVEPVVTATNRQEHYHHHHRQNTIRSGSADSMNLLNEHSFHHHHHHDDHQSSSSRNRTVELPRYSDYGRFDLATCSVSPNRAIPEDKQQNVAGTVTLWQKKTGGPLNFHVQLQGFDVGDHHAHHQQLQTEDNETPVGHRHGFHIHASGDLSDGCQSTGPHFNPKGTNHGGRDNERHIGDLGNIECDEHGYTNILFSDDVASLRGQYSVIGKAIVIHAMEDDLGLGGNPESLKTGNAGTRLACCVIQKVEKIPMRVYRSMKTATQYQNYS